MSAVSRLLVAASLMSVFVALLLCEQSSHMRAASPSLWTISSQSHGRPHVALQKLSPCANDASRVDCVAVPADRRWTVPIVNGQHSAPVDT